MKDSFVLYTNYYDILKDTPNEDLGAIFKAILYYVKMDECLELPPHLSLAFGFIKNQLDLDIKKYDEKVERMKSNAKKGIESKKSKSEENLRNADFREHNVNENENENENENVNENVLSLNNTQKEKINREDREILENYIVKNKLATKNTSAYMRKIIENGDHREILEKEKSKIARKSKTREQVIQEELASIVDKYTCAKVLYKYYSTGDFPPYEFDQVANKYEITSYDELAEYIKELEKERDRQKLANSA